jgi:hypothetical protein
MDSSGHGAEVHDPHAASADEFKQPSLDLDQRLATFVCDRLLTWNRHAVITCALGVAVPGCSRR